MQRGLAATLTIGAVLWAVVLFAAPLALSRGAVVAAPASALLYQASGRICHQRPERTFTVAGVRQPVCARCAGLYVSGAAGALLAWAFAAGRTAGGRAGRVLLAAAALPTALTFGAEAAGLAFPSSLVRAVAALPLGAAGGWLFVSALRAERMRYDPRTDGA